MTRNISTANGRSPIIINYRSSENLCSRNHLDVALIYAADLGWPIFPVAWIREDGLCTCGRSTCRSPGKHPWAAAAPNGFKDASRNPHLVRAWWKKWPNANIGVATGLASGLVVVDIDPRNQGDLDLEELEARHGKLPDTPMSLTGGGGQYYFFACPEEGFAPGKLAGGIDIKADGGYVVLPPSNHASGGVYE